MSKSPEEYFQEQEFQPEPESSEESFTEAEKAFLEKYLGLEEPGILEKLGIDAPVEAGREPVPLPEAREPFEAQEPQSGPALEETLEEVLDEAPEVQEQAQAADKDEETPLAEAGTEEETAQPAALEDETGETGYEELLAEEEAFEAEEEQLPEVEEQRLPADEAVPEESAQVLPEEEEGELEDRLREQEKLQLVSFYVGHQEYTLPIEAVQEVVRAVKPTQVPEAPEYMAGLVNLRGRVTPLIRPDVLLGVERGKSSGEETDDGEDRFIIVCSRKGLQVGLLVRKVATMYHVQQNSMEWNIESRLGGSVELVTALMRRQDDSLVGVVSIDRVVERLLKR